MSGGDYLRKKRQQEELEHERMLAAIRAGNPSSASDANVSERPPLHDLACEQIDALLHQVDKRHWPTITEMRVKRYYPPDEPVPPPKPEHLVSQLRWYASMLFKTEADQYQQFRGDARYSVWLSRLADRVTARTLTALRRLEEGDIGSTIMGYHGVTVPQAEQELRTLLGEIAAQYAQGIAPGQLGGTVVTRPPVAPETGMSQTTAQAKQSIGDQIAHWLAECDMTREEMAESLGINVRQVYRHCAGETTPRRSHLVAYQRVFSEKLGRPITIRTSDKRHVMS